MLDLNPINERLNKATPGPWKHGCNRYGWSVFTDARPVLLIGDLWTKNGQDPSWALNADLIANAPTDLRAMSDEIERLRKKDAALLRFVHEKRMEAMTRTFGAEYKRAWEQIYEFVHAAKEKE